MRLKYYALVTITALTTSGAAMAECDKPELPAIADGASASKEAMIESQQAVKQYLAESDGYLNCLKEEEKATVAAAKADGVKPESEEAKAIEQKRVAITQAYNSTVDAMHDLGDRFNAEIKAYNAANK